MNALTDIASYIGLLMVIIGLHEFGHYIVAKRFGLIAETFSLGFGKILLAYTDRSGTSWQIRAMPFGGFIKLNNDRLISLPPSRRIAIYAAGPAVNIALGIVLVAAAGIAMGTPALKSLEISLRVVPTIVAAFVGAITDIFSGNISSLSGPIGSAIASGNAVRQHGIIMFAALFSWSVGILNLLPVPLLDGGQILLSSFEAAAGKPTDNAMKYAAWAGNSFIGCLILAGFTSDLIRIIG
jgi:regulator of sigma E protease